MMTSEELLYSGDKLLGTGYSLVDSGDFMKLERLGEKLIARPSSLCIWRKSAAEAEWRKADATYLPKQGWTFKGQKFEKWEVAFDSFSLRLRLQDNGQVGLFPEHANSLVLLAHLISSRPANDKSPLNVLNLFAFTGMASIVLAGLGCKVCHVDLSKKALSWARENFELNKIPPEQCRLIPEDSLTFLQKEIRRKNGYNAIIIDPPSFSRTSSAAWKLEDVIHQMIDACSKLLIDKGLLVFSCHHSAINAAVLRNLLLDNPDNHLSIISSKDLAIPETDGKRSLPAGCYVLCRKELPL
ncbi:MAG: class I SAM-dependent methyltransferase [Deltaproteobacteria bacterium]|nr:class I SAM-dependent methyltransferase [Deltaproteobacteria bacterium]